MMQPNMTLRRLLWRFIDNKDKTVNIEDDFIDRMNMEVIDPADDAAKYDIEKAVLDIPEDDETIIQLCILRMTL